MADAPLHTLAIVGAGFSGTATAVHMLRQVQERPLRLVLIERGDEFGRGTPYARTRYPYLLNVPASRMSATTADPGEFLRFALTRDARTDGEDFLPRALYGDYLQELLATAVADAPARVEIDRIHGDVIDADLDTSSAATTLALADGRRVRAQRVVLALGTPAPRLPTAIHCMVGPPEVRPDPWNAGRQAHEGPLLVIGTGLTMIDVVSAALEDNPRVVIHAISRHGLIPPSQTAFRPDALEGDGGLLESCAGSISRLLTAVRHLAGEAERRGGDWREVVTLLRRQVPALWSTLPPCERSRFIRHARAYWDIHRHRAPAAALEKLAAARASGQLTVHAGRLRSLDATELGVRATWIPRGSSNPRSLDVVEVINCSGPDYDVRRSPDRLWQALLAKGLATPDDLALGVRTAEHGALVRRDGSTCRQIYYVGPMLRAEHWEATAVGELRVHAEQLASYLSKTGGSPKT